MSNYPYEVVMAAGCHREPYSPVVSRHRTLDAAVRVARPRVVWAVPLAGSYLEHVRSGIAAVCVVRGSSLSVRIRNASGGYQVYYSWAGLDGGKLPPDRVGFTSHSYSKTCAQVRADVRSLLGWRGE